MLKGRNWPVWGLSLLLLFFVWACENPKDPAQMEETLESVPKPIYNKTATMLSLAWTSYINSGMEGSVAELQNHAKEGVYQILKNPNVVSCIGSWSLEWGPVAYTHDSAGGNNFYTDNTMMLVKGRDPDNLPNFMYVVAIAGTNSSSVFDWQSEDLAGTEMVKWPDPTGESSNTGAFSNPVLEKDPAVTNTGNYISQGITTGLNILLNEMKDDGKTLMEYLKTRFSRTTMPSEIAVTGHSLGGGLSPCVALSLRDNQDYWNISKSFKVTTYPFAGQSPGNQNFANYFHRTIGTDQFKGSYNTMDVVPHGFQADMMAQIPTIYDGIDVHLANQCLIAGLINCVKPSIDPFNYATLYNKENAFTYNVVYNDSAYQSGLKGYEHISYKEAAGIRYFCGWLSKAKEEYARSVNFANMAMIQHLNAYIEQYGIHRVEAVIRANQLGGETPSFSSIIYAPIFDKCWPGENVEQPK